MKDVRIRLAHLSEENDLQPVVSDRDWGHTSASQGGESCRLWHQRDLESNHIQAMSPHLSLLLCKKGPSSASPSKELLQTPNAHNVCLETEGPSLTCCEHSINTRKCSNKVHHLTFLLQSSGYQACNPSEAFKVE